MPRKPRARIQKLIASTRPASDTSAEVWKEAESAFAAEIEASIANALKWPLDERADGLAALQLDHELLAQLFEPGDGLEALNDACAALFDQRGDHLEALDFDGDLLKQLLP